MHEYERDLEAIRRVVQGEPISQVCADIGRSRTWFYKRRACYRQHGLAGLQDQRPGHAPVNRTPEGVRELIVQTRDRLVRAAAAGEHHLGIGAQRITQELEALGIPSPHPRTVYRILAQAQRTARAPAPRGYCPCPPAERANDVHQLDFWPRILAGGERLFLVHLVDIATWYPCGWVSPDKSTDTLLPFLLENWQRTGVPGVLQIDNEMSFTGGRWAAHLGRLVRLALLLGCEVWFNPFATPECNAYVERFHGLCDQFFWTRHHFLDRDEVVRHYPSFLQAFREEHRPERLAGRTPAQARQAMSDGRICTLPQGLHWRTGQSLPLVGGRIHCVRRTDSHGRLSVLGRSFTLGSEYRYAYVKATLTTVKQQVTFFYQAAPDAKAELVSTQPFPLPERVKRPKASLIFRYLA
jgi:hypothetical protein